MKTINKNRKNLVSAILLLTLLFAAFMLGGSLFSVLAPAQNTAYLEEGIYPNAADYTISRIDSTYYAKDAYGQIPSWGIGTNATDIIQTAIDDMETDTARELSGTIVLKGNITIQNTIVLPDYLNFYFETLNIASDVDGIFLNGSEGDWGATLLTVVKGKFVQFENSYTSHVITLYNCIRVTVEVESMFVHDGPVGTTGSVGILLHGDSAPNSWNTVKVDHLGGLETGVMLLGEGSGYVTANTIEAFSMSYLVVGIDIHDNGTGCSGNTIKNSNYNGNWVGSEYGFINEHADNTYRNIRCIDTNSPTIDFWNNASSYCRIIDSQLWEIRNDNTDENSIAWKNNNFDNLGYSEQSGIITSPSNGSYFAHWDFGLYTMTPGTGTYNNTTPTTILLTCNSTTYCYAWIAESNASHFRYYFNPTTPTSIYWYTEYHP